VYKVFDKDDMGIGASELMDVMKHLLTKKNEGKVDAELNIQILKFRGQAPSLSGTSSFGDKPTSFGDKL
jgi:hypothetical protein